MNAKATYYVILLTIIIVAIGSSILGPILNLAVPVKIDSPTESFLSPGKYPLAVTKPLLYTSYNTKPDPGVSDFSSSDIISDYPMFPASSCQNNNIRYWRRPNNGACSPADFCGGIYETTEPNIPPPPGPPSNQGVRVNYYDSVTFCQ